jgi:hypothetical protein
MVSTRWRQRKLAISIVRFVNTPTIETCSKEAATMGDVVICAPGETQMRFDSCLGGLFSGLSKVCSRRDFRVW